MTGALTARAVSHTYRYTQALAPTTLTVDAGTVHAITGPSGCGKSTLARILAGLLEPTAGEVHCDGTAVVAKRRLGSEIAWLPQNAEAGLDPNLTLGRSIRLAADFAGHSTTDETITDLATTVGLEHELLDARPGQVSGGQAQRACFARALAQKPRYLVADEPTAHLDAESTATVAAQIATAADRGLGVALFTHDHELAHMLAGSRTELGLPAAPRY